MILNPLFKFYIAKLNTNFTGPFKIKNAHQVILLLNGSFYFEKGIVENDCLDKNSLIFLTPENFNLVNEVKNAGFYHIAFHKSLFNFPGLSDFEKNIFKELNLFNIEKNIVHYNLEKNFISELDLLFSQMEEEFKGKRPNYHYVIKYMFLEFIMILHRHVNQNELKPFRKNSITGLIDFIDNNFTESLTLNSLANKSGFNPSYLSRAFKEKTGQTLFEYINYLRIKKACRFLKSTNHSVLEISTMVGYNNLSFFNRYFKKLIGKSPRDYKNS